MRSLIFLIAMVSFVPLSWCDEKENHRRAPTLQLAIDAIDLPRKLLRATLVIPVDDQVAVDGNRVKLWYPMWVPGAHAPGGPIANVVGLNIRDAAGQSLEWKRTPGEVFQITVIAPPAARELYVQMEYAANQPTTNSFGIDSFGSDLLGVINPNTLLLYPDGVDIDELQVRVTIQLPSGWTAATALPRSATETIAAMHEPSTANVLPHTNPVPANTIKYQPVSLRTCVDSPLMCGKYRREYSLVEAGNEGQIPPHRLHVFSEAESVLDVDELVLQRLRQMVTETARLFRSHPFDQFDLLLATTDQIPANGLEHSWSSFNVLSQRDLQSPQDLKGWDRLLIPHEYIHAWCGKYRIPIGMLKRDFHTPLDTELLWVYEGLTQYLGELIEARCELMSPDEFRHRLSLEIRQAIYQQGREWRSLADTGAASHTLRTGSDSWSRLRRSQDYYMEGMLMWLEADAIIRTESRGSKSLDDFCRVFFDARHDDSHPRGFDSQDIVTSLENVVPYDWKGFLHRRSETTSSQFDPQVVDLLGYRIQYSPDPPDIPRETYRSFLGIDGYDSIGALIGDDGVVRDLLRDSPVHNAGLGPGMRIAGINGHTWSPNRMRDAIAMSATEGDIKLMIVAGDTFQTLTVNYRGGPRYMHLVRQPERPDLLESILRPLRSPP